MKSARQKELEEWGGFVAGVVLSVAAIGVFVVGCVWLIVWMLTDIAGML